MRKQKVAKTLSKVSRFVRIFILFVDTSPFSKAQYDELVWIALFVALTRNDGSRFAKVGVVLMRPRLEILRI